MDAPSGTQFDDKPATERTGPTVTMPTSTASTWIGVYVIGAVGVLVAIRWSFRRFT